MKAGQVALGLMLSTFAVVVGCSSQNASDDNEDLGTVGEALAAPSPCLSPPANTLFCADFDHVTNVGDGWTQVIAEGKGKGKLDTNHFSSAPASLEAKGIYTQRVITNAAVNASLDLDLDLRVDKPAAGWFARSTQTGSSLTLSLDAASQLVVTEGAGAVHTTTAVIATKSWTHVKLHATSTSLQASINGVLVLDVAPQAALPPGTRTLEIGAQDGKLSFDNVLVTDPPVPAAFYCDSLPPATTLYCNDFDKPGSPITSCSSVDSTTFVSAPFSCARGGFPVPPSLDVTVHGATVTPTFDVDVRLDQVTPGTLVASYTVSADAGQCPVGTTPCSGNAQITIDAAGSLVAMLQAGLTRRTVTLATPTAGTWFHLRGIGSAAGGMTLSIDGVAKAGISFLVKPGSRRLAITGNGIHIDNVVLADQ